MKGIIFTEFLEMVEDTYNLETVDYIIQNSNLKSKGVYTSVGDYNYKELFSLVSSLNKKVNIGADKLIYNFGQYFFNSLTKLYPRIFKEYKSPDNFLSSIENRLG